LKLLGCRFSVITSRILRAKTSTFVIYLPFSRRFFVKSKRGGMIGFMMRAIAWLAVFLDEVAVGCDENGLLDHIVAN
jgi:hypothetical protein